MLRRGYSLGLLLVLLATLVAGCVQPVPVAPAAGSEAASPAAENTAEESAGDPVAGGAWSRSSSADASILNPILSSDASSSAIHSMLVPGLIGADPFTGEFVPEGSMSERWEVSEDGLVWTFFLRDGVTWSDGDPVDAADFKFTYDAIASDLVETPRKSAIEQIESIEVLDPLTLQITFKQVKCDGLGDLGLGWLPSHLFASDFSDVMTNSYNEAPQVSAGPFVFQSWTRDDNTILTRNERYWEGAPHMDGMIYRVVPDSGTRLAQLLSGEIDITGLEPAQLTSVEGNPDINVYSFQDDGYDYIGLNLANPANPLPGKDEEGNLIVQEPHPILGDLNVRKAIAHALDYKTIIDSVYLGRGYQIASNVLPAVKWAHDPSIQPYAYDLERSQQLLEEAGWVDSDGDGVREKEGVKLSLTLITNAGNKVREDLGALVQDQLAQTGIQIDLQTIDFGTVVEQLLGQTYDMVIIGWTGLGSDPNDDVFWRTDFDTPGSGFNFVSYQNPEIDELLQAGVAVAGCDPATRAPYYQKIQQIIHDDVPYVFISGGVGDTGYNNRWANLDPGPWSFYWNVHQWWNKTLAP
ncbi:MAG: ABC transporter substrate-binding protein [Caldilinea sp.]|jgi:peptide/nickel transport system substrate-binding protein